MMNHFLAEHFKKQLKPFLKKYRHLGDDLVSALKIFDKRQASPLGGNVYKLRLKTSDLPKGKSSSFRLIIFLLEHDDLIIPLAIYFKSERKSISLKEINEHLVMILAELRAG